MAAGDNTYSGTVDAGGGLVVSIRPQGRQTWTVSQVSVEMDTAPPEATCVVRKNQALISPVVAQGDAASGDPPVVIRPNDRLTVTWANCTPGDLGSVYIVYDDGN